jgi:hypothetical protein
MNFDELLARLRAGGATLSLDELRFLSTELRTRAEAMPGQITAETPPADAERLEREHQALVADAERVRGQIADAERAAAVAANSNPDVAAAIRADRVRAGSIRALQADFGARYAIPAEFFERHINEGTSESDVRLAVLEQMRGRSERNPSSSHVQVITDEAATRREGMTAAIVARLAQAAGERNVEVPAIAREWASRDLVEIAADCVGERGPMRTGRQVDEIFRRAFMTTSDFPGIFTNALGVRLLARYQAAAPTYRLWAARSDSSLLSVASPVVRAGDFPALQKVNEAGEIKSGSFGEMKEQHKVDAYAVMLRISRQMLVNDQIGAIEQVLASAGERIANWENSLAYDVLLTASGVGPTLLSDSTPVFNAAHGNLAGSGAAPSVTTIGAAIAAMMVQESLDGIPLNLAPRSLVVGPAILITAQQLLTAITPAQVTNVVPESIRMLQPAADAKIAGNAWYLFADPNIAPAFVYGYLDGNTGPRLTSEDTFDQQGLKVKLEHDFGVSAVDYRGAYRNPGA